MKEENKKKNEELQSRRQFFKKAGKAALPILGAVVLSSVPLIGKASTTPSGCGYMSCESSCSGGCMGCSGTCTGGCSSMCGGNCVGNCSGSCAYGCSGYSKM